VDNFILPAYPGLIVKDSYWRWPERNLAGNAIDFHVQVLGLPFHDAMRQISPAHNPAASIITLRRQFGQKPVQRQNPGLTMPVRQDPGAAITYDLSRRSSERRRMPMW
jgi:hypothetical protein